MLFFILVTTPVVAMGRTSVDSLPLVDVGPSAGGTHPLFAVLISGDGGWAGIDRSIAGYLAAHGVPVTGLDSLRYFWREKDPNEFARDLEAIIEARRARWGSSEVIVIGYSRGADVLPFALARLHSDRGWHVRLAALLGPSREVSFQFKMIDWLGASRNGFPTLPEAEKVHGIPMLCVRGADETDSLCPALPATLAQQMVLPGGHHFDGDYEQIAARILQRAESR